MQAVDCLIIGVGNLLRRDDGAGFLLAEAACEALAQRGKVVQIRQSQQLLPELAEEIGELQPRAVLIADCCADPDSVAGGPAGQVNPLPADATAAVGPAFGSHGMAPAALLTLARRLYGYAGAAWLATVPGCDFGHGAGLSPSTRQAIDDLLPAVVECIA